MNLLRRLFIFLFILLALGFGALLLLQSQWTKNQLVQVLQSMATQAGVKLSIGQIEGELPLKWNFSQVELTLPKGETIQIDALQIRLALLPLFWNEFGLSYLHADKVIMTYSPTDSNAASEPSLPQFSFFLHLATVDQFVLINQETQESAIVRFAGNGRWVKGGKSFSAQVSVHSQDLDGEAYLEGNKNQKRVDIKLKAHSRKAFSPFYTSPVNLPFELQLALKETNGSIHGNMELNCSLFALRGSVGLDTDFLPSQAKLKLVVPDFSNLSSSLKGEALGEFILNGRECHLSFTIPQVTIDRTTFTKTELKIEARQGLEGWSGPVTLSANHPTLGVLMSGKLYWESLQSIAIKEFGLQSSIGQVAGDFAYLKGLEGGISFQITDLAPLSELTATDLAGQIGGTLQFEGTEWGGIAVGKSLKINQFLSDRIEMDIQLFDFWKLKAFKLKSEPSYLQKAYFNSFSYEMGWNGAGWDYKVQTSGDWKGSFDLKSHGKIDFSKDYFRLLCHELEANILETAVNLQKSFEFSMSKEKFNCDQLSLNLDGSPCFFSALISPQEAFFKLKADHFPLDFLTLFSSRLSLHGTSSLDIDLQASGNRLVGHAHLGLTRADIYPTGASFPIQTKGSLQVNFSDSILQLHTHLIATGEQLCDLSATLPFQFHLSPLRFKWVKDRPVAGQCTIEGASEQLFDFINMGSQRFGGFISTHLLLSGTLEKPILRGPISIQGGFYENYFIGIAVKDAEIAAVATGKEVVVREATATDGEKGESSSTAVFHLTKNLPFFVQGTVKHFRVIRFDWLTGACSGPYTIDGNLEKALAKATLELDEADVSIPDQLPSDLPTLPVTFINQGESHLEKLTYSEAYPFCYELDVHGDHDLRMSGRGLEAELEGTVHMTGKNLSVVAAGTLFTKKGKFSFAGKDFNIIKGELIFSESSAFMNITSVVELPNLTVTVHFRGSLSDPQLIFESSPALATSSIISHILFNKDVSELSTPQAIQLANTIVSLSGGSGTNLLESIRKGIGVDRLSFSASEEGQVSVQIGKYLTHGVTITLNQSTESSLIKVEVELKGGFMLEAETQEDSQGKFSFKWNKNY